MTRRYVVQRPLLEDNIRRVREAAGDAAVYAVLKADAYGLGLAPAARVLAGQGVERFALTEPSDALALCSLGLPVREVLLLRPVRDRDTAEELMRLGRVTFAVGAPEDAAALSSVAAVLGLRPRAHVQLDTGLGRYGIPWSETTVIREVYERFPTLEIAGIYTHFACSCSERAARRQFERFSGTVRALRTAGIAPGLRHCCGSSALFRYPGMRLDAVRVGSAFLGRMPDAGRYGLHPACWCEAAVEGVRTLPAGARLGYGGLYRARRETRVAVVNVGTTHGLGIAPGHGQESASAWLRELAGLAGGRLFRRRRLSAELNGASVPVLGQACAECAMLDVTGVPCAPGDGVRLNISPLYQRNMDCVWLG